MHRQIPIVGGFYRDPNLHWSRQDCLNWIPVRAERAGGLTEWQLRDAPGLRPAVQVRQGPGGIRGARNVEGKLFVVVGNTLYQITNAGVAVARGTIPGVGRVSMAHNAKGLGNELLIVNGSAGYVYDTQTQKLAKVADTGYPGATVVDFVDQYLAQVEPQGRYWFHSDLADAHNYNTLDRYQAEGDPDRIVSLLVSHREVLVFGAQSIEPYVNTGGATGTFERTSNTVIECGCAARFTPRRLDNSAFWLDDQRLVRRLDGYTPVILSTEAIAAAFRECTQAEVSQAYAFTWEDAGHKVYYITVPGRFTFGYDAKTGEWHRRASFGLPHWAVSDVVFWNGRWYACDSRFPRLYELDPEYKLDGTDPLVRERTAGVLWAEQNDLTLDEVELLFNTGGRSTIPEEASARPLSLTSPPYPTAIVESTAVSAELLDVSLRRVRFDAEPPPESLQVSASLQGLTLRYPIAFADAPMEAVALEPSLVGITLRAPRVYASAPTERLAVTPSLHAITHRAARLDASAGTEAVALTPSLIGVSLYVP